MAMTQICPYHAPSLFIVSDTILLLSEVISVSARTSPVAKRSRKACTPVPGSESFNKLPPVTVTYVAFP